MTARGRRLLAAAGVAVLAASGPGRAGAAACPALDYEATLTAAAAALHQAPPDVATSQRDVLALLGTGPPPVLALAPVAADLAAHPPQLADARTRLDSMSAALAYPAHSTCNVSAAAAESSLHDVYASPSLRHLDDVAQPGVVETVLSFLSRLLGGLTGALGAAGTAALAALILGAAALLAWRRWRGDAGTGGAAVAEPPSPGDDADEEWRAATAAAGRGDHREAVRRAFRAALIDVAVRGGLRLDAAWTTREVLARCSADAEVLAALAAAAALFDRAWYGAAPVTEADWRVGADRCATVRRLVRARRVAAS